MNLHKSRLLLPRFIFLLVVAFFGCGAQAASGNCSYHGSGTGMGGTGMKPDDDASQMQTAGNVVFSRGTVRALNKGHSRLLAKGAQVCVGETISTSEAGMVQIRMLDTGFISVRPESMVRIDAFHFNGKEDGTERTAFYLIQGAFRAVTGLVGHHNKDNYKIETPTATIGIRGTDHEPMYIPDPAPGHISVGQPGTYDKVNSGGVYIRTSSGSVDVKPNQVGFAPIVPNVAPVILKEIPRFYHIESGAELKSGSTEQFDNHGGSKEVSDRLPKSEHGSSSDVRAPDLHVPAVHASGIQSPSIPAPEGQSSDSRNSTVQIPPVQVPAVQPSSIEAPEH